jgi:hypothetical protein
MPGLPPSKLALKVGAPIMLIRNLSQEEGGLCSGTRLIITGLYDWNVIARIIASDYKGAEHMIPRGCTNGSLLNDRQVEARVKKATTGRGIDEPNTHRRAEDRPMRYSSKERARQKIIQ